MGTAMSWANFDESTERVVDMSSRCGKCGYDLTGFADPRCPRCGKEDPTRSGGVGPEAGTGRKISGIHVVIALFLVIVVIGLVAASLLW